MPELEFDFGVSTVVNGAIQIGIIVAAAIVLVLVGRWLIPRIIAARIPRVRKEPSDEQGARAKTISDALVRVFSIVICALAATMVLGQLGVDIGPLLAGLGVGALALGFAAQNIIRDYLNGFFILMEDWYRIGEWVGAVGLEGTVERITLRRTILREIDGTVHHIPNSQISLASNRMRDWGRINLTVSVAYKENLDQVYAVTNEVCQGLKDDPEWGGNLLTTPAVVRVGNLGDHGVGIVIRGDTKAGYHWALTGELRRRIKNRFDVEGIEIPWPHTKVYFGNAPDAGG
jgi:small-conductance mechanosensitive channel